MTARSQPQGGVGASWKRLSAVLFCASMLLVGADALRREVLEAASSPPGGRAMPPSQWKLGTSAVEPLRGSLDQVGRLVPEGALLAVHAPQLSPPELFFLSMWCSYYLPRHRVLRLGVIEERHRSPAGNYVLVWPPDGASGRGREIYRDESVSVRRLPQDDAAGGDR